MLMKISRHFAIEMLTDDALIEKVYVKLATGYHPARGLYWYFGKTTGEEAYDGKLNFNTAEFYRDVDEAMILKEQYDQGLVEGMERAKREQAETDESDRAKVDKVDAELKCMPQGVYKAKGYEQGE
ncbi:MAG TPA: hypothetical protein VFD17_00130 [Clostridia bacterium]|nr:hypothetical protein [Clostridia bacterium]